jgi:hypothetical protein
MNRWYLFMVVLAFPALMLAQENKSPYATPNYASQPYTPAVPAASTSVYGGGYGGYYSGGGTVAGSAMNGMANCMSSAGSMHLSNSAAAINMTQAQKNSIQNQQLAASTYLQMQDENKAWQKAQRGPPATKEQIARWARDAAPKAVTPDEVNPATGKVNWPVALQQDNYAAQRAELDQLLAKKATYGRLSYADQTEARKTIETMFDTMKSQIKDIPPQDYVASREFLRSIIYATSQATLE